MNGCSALPHVALNAQGGRAYEASMEEGFDPTMDLQEALQGLSLQPKCDVAHNHKDDIVGDILSNSNFRRFLLKDMVQKVWKLKSRCILIMLAITFLSSPLRIRKTKIEFLNKGHGHLMAHLILKEWSEYMGLQEVDFNFTTFHIQVHGLSRNIPPSRHDIPNRG
ncbi:hypothetical protein FNV43_RR20301 [Rhamnella rubrinervis]|uniref:Uncharacterized protein n=1 Tax=Rhamnella rubrinervis TaxID=2594499 RepID=A0A8K0GQC0_9ROSA|nr:hypothetical protein FNV43_RR20301 [Rhamnella rubrinervis]